MEKIPRSLGTHNGSFHADEVTACALLLLFDCIDEKSIFRTREEAILECCEYVCDVGGIYNPEIKRFDHHQKDYEGGLSSAGMILLYLLEIGKMSLRDFQFFKEALIFGVDAHDNGKELAPLGVCTYSHIIASFVPILHEALPEEQDLGFWQAVNFSKNYLKRIWERKQYIHSCEKLVSLSMEKNKEYLVFDQSIPWLESFFELGGETHPAKFVVMPTGGQWKLRGIPPSLLRKMEVRHPLPSEWAGLMGEELKKISGVEGAVFCHKGRFISVWETEKDAMKALRFVLGGKLS